MRNARLVNSTSAGASFFECLNHSKKALVINS